MIDGCPKRWTDDRRESRVLSMGNNHVLMLWLTKRHETARFRVAAERLLTYRSLFFTEREPLMKSSLSALSVCLAGGALLALGAGPATAAPTCSIGEVRSWGSEFVLRGIVFQNDAEGTVVAPEITLAFGSDVSVNRAWGGSIVSSGNRVVLTGVDYNARVEPGRSARFSVMGTGRSDGVTCSVSSGTSSERPVQPEPVAAPTLPDRPDPRPDPRPVAAPAPQPLAPPRPAVGRPVPAPTPMPMPMPDNVSAGADDNDDRAIARNLALIAGNATRNTGFDSNSFRDVPARDISVSDLTLDYDIYDEALLDTSTSGYFRVKCEVSHFAYDDPIVFPGQPGRAHLHMFFGNTRANAFSTFDSLLNTGTGSCNGEDLNRSSYWVPAMLDKEGNALVPDQIMVYYKNDNFRLNGANELVSPFPDNLRMIAGNGAAVSPQTGYTGSYKAQPTVSFSCGRPYRADDRRQALIPDCYGSDDQLEMQVAFPQCVDGTSGAYRSDQSHVSYSEGGYYGYRCPESHSTDISSIMYRIFYSPADYGGALTDLHLSSDVKMDRILPGGTTAHADWFGAWHPDAMRMWVDNCNNTQADCETGLLGRNPAVSLVMRKRGFYPPGYRAPAAELVKLCRGKTHDPRNPLSVGMCRMN